MPESSQMAVRHPFSYRLYRAVWICTLVANISVWMQNVGAAWLMTSLTPSPLMVALIQTATSLPAFLFGMPAGVLADQHDRRAFLIASHTWMLLTSILLCALAWFNLVTPTLLLLGTFMLGTGSILSVPAGQAATYDAVPRAALLPAVALNAVAYNGARALGPALAGVILARFGPATVFLINSGLFAVVVAVYTFGYAPPRSHAPQPEGMLAAIRSGIRYVRHSSSLRSIAVRTMLFVGCASALWALLPLVARQRPGFGASDYGILLACMGGGAVSAGVCLGRLRAYLSLNVLTSGASALFAAAMVAAAYLDEMLPLCAALMLGGAAWVSFTSVTSAAFQTSLPQWVRARALAVLMLAFHVAMALGALAWGSMANWIGVPMTLAYSAALALAGMLWANRTPVRMGADDEVTPMLNWNEPVVIGSLVPEVGPVLIQIAYRVDPHHADQFTRRAYELDAMRRRNGASGWRLFRDAGAPHHYVERFMFGSWAEYLRQHQRMTIADRSIEQKLLPFLEAGSAPQAEQFINHPYPHE